MKPLHHGITDECNGNKVLVKSWAITLVYIIHGIPKMTSNRPPPFLQLLALWYAQYKQRLNNTCYSNFKKVGLWYIVK